MKARFIPLAGFVFFAVAMAFLLMRGGDFKSVPSAVVGKPAPTAFAGADGKAYLVNFFASWCGPCAEEQPVLLEFSKKTGVAVQGIRYKDKADSARRFLSIYGDPFDAIVADDDGRIAIDWGVSGVPETFVVSASGRVLYHHAGLLTAEDFKKHVAPHLKGSVP